MDALERDYRTVLLADHEPPCLSLYQPTHRAHPDNQQDAIRFRNLVKTLAQALARNYADRESAPILRRFYELAENGDFWNRALNGLAVFATSGLFKVYRLQRPVKELTVVADSFHTKPLMRIVQSADNYHVLGLNREQASLYEGNRDGLDEVELAPGLPRTHTDVTGVNEDEPERTKRAYGRVGPGLTTRHGTNVRQDLVDNETERFFRAVDEAVIEQYSRPARIPLLLAALPEHHHLFRAVSRNPFLLAETIDTYPSALSLDQLRERAWQLLLPRYLERLGGFIEQFGASKAEERGGVNLAEVAQAAAAGRVAMLLIEADRVIPGRFDPVSGAIAFAPLDDPEVDDLLDDVSEHVLRTDGEVVIVPADRMPTDTGIAAIYRF